MATHADELDPIVVPIVDDEPMMTFRERLAALGDPLTAPARRVQVRPLLSET